MSIEKLSSILCVLFVAFIFITYINEDEEVPKNEKVISNITNDTSSKTNNDLQNTDKIYKIKTDELYGSIVAIDRKAWDDYQIATILNDQDKLLDLDLHGYIFYVKNDTKVEIFGSIENYHKVAFIKILSGEHQGATVYILKTNLQQNVQSTKGQARS
ncbi:hypothetical protein ACTVJH_11085 [Desulfoplanes sp. PS50]|jgi:hypothetical protein